MVTVVIPITVVAAVVVVVVMMPVVPIPAIVIVVVGAVPRVIAVPPVARIAIAVPVPRLEANRHANVRVPVRITPRERENRGQTQGEPCNEDLHKRLLFGNRSSPPVLGSGNLGRTSK